MTPNITILDTNAVLRFVMNDITEQSQAVVAVINTHICIIPVEIIAEMVYVLEKFYHFTHDEITLLIEYIIAYKDGLVEYCDVVSYGANLFSTTKLDFVDCLLAGYQKLSGCTVFTFDKELKKQLQTQ
jgi:predicted nucleic-acid-binding protein